MKLYIFLFPIPTQQNLGLQGLASPARGVNVSFPMAI